MRCRICNTTNVMLLLDELSSFSAKPFYPDPENHDHYVCYECAEQIWDGELEEHEADEASEGLELDEVTESEVEAYLKELDDE